MAVVDWSCGCCHSPRPIAKPRIKSALVYPHRHHRFSPLPRQHHPTRHHTRLIPLHVECILTYHTRIIPGYPIEMASSTLKRKSSEMDDAYPNDGMQTPTSSPSRKKMRLTRKQKQALIDNLQLESMSISSSHHSAPHTNNCSHRTSPQTSRPVRTPNPRSSSTN